MQKRSTPLRITSLITLLLSFSAVAETNTVPNKAKSDVKSVTVYAAGDIADCGKFEPGSTYAAASSNLIDKALKEDQDALAITLGDNTYPIGKLEEFTKCYEPTWGRYKDRTLPSPGNHDYGMPQAIGYFTYFGELAGPNNRGYYSKDVGAWRVYSLNSNISGIQMQTQLAWLKEELKSHPKQCTLAFWHHPVFSSGGHGDNKIMIEAWRLLQNANADLVLVGHDHDYERFAPLTADGVRNEKTGIRSFVVGTGGAHLTPMFLPKKNTVIRSNNSYGVLKLNLHATSYDWEFLSVGGDPLNDKGSAQCHIAQ